MVGVLTLVKTDTSPVPAGLPDVSISPSFSSIIRLILDFRSPVRHTEALKSLVITLALSKKLLRSCQDSLENLLTKSSEGRKSLYAGLCYHLQINRLPPRILFGWCGI